MEFHLRVDPFATEEVRAVLHERTALADQLEELVRQYAGTDRIMGYARDGQKELRFCDIECVLTQAGKTYALDRHGERFLLKARLYEVERMLPECFFRINKSALANRERIERFTAAFSGAVNVRFQCGYQDYVSRRCFRAIKERLGIK